MSKIIAEGDSWFALSKLIKLKIFGIKRTDVINELKKLGYDIESVADKGDTIEEMAVSKDQFKEFKKKLQKLAEPPGAILFSGGGNDIKGSLKKMLNGSSLQRNSNPLNENEVTCFIGRLRDAYLILLKKIDELCEEKFNNTNTSKIPVLIHGYVYSVPDGRRFANDKSEGNLSFALFGDLLFRSKRGPWIQPKFKEKSYTDLTENTETMKKLSNRFNGLLEQLDPDKNYFSNIYVQHVDVRECWINKLQNNDYQKYWDDEFHPSECGFKLIAKKFHCVIQNLSTIPV